MMPDARLFLNNVKIFEEYTIVKFELENFVELEINNFEFDASIANGYERGWTIFKFVSTSDNVDTKFTLTVNNMKLTKFIFDEADLFVIPLQHANVEIRDLYLYDCIFKNAALLTALEPKTSYPKRKILLENV